MLSNFGKFCKFFGQNFKNIAKYVKIRQNLLNLKTFVAEIDKFDKIYKIWLQKILWLRLLKFGQI